MDYSIVRSHAEVLRQLGYPLYMARWLLCVIPSKKKLHIVTQTLQ